MHIEERLESIDTTLKAILTVLQSGQQITATLESTADASAPAEPTKKPRGRPAKTVDAASGPGTATTGDAPEKTDSASSQPAVSAETAQPASTAADSGNAAPAATAAASAPAAAPAASATTSSAGSEPTWDEVVKSLMGLKDNPAHGAAAVVAILKEIDPNATNVPALKDKGHNAKIMAAINARLNPPAAAPAADPLFG